MSVTMGTGELQDALATIRWGVLHPSGQEVPGFHETLRSIRETVGVARGLYIEDHPCYLITRYADVRESFLDTATFSPRSTQELLSFPYTGPTMLGFEGDHHTAFRQVVNRHFTKRDIGRWVQSMLRPQAERIVDAFADHGSAELMADFGKVYPLAVISEMIGLPVDDWSRVAAWARVIILGDDSANREESERHRIDAAEQLRQWLRPVIAARREEPRDDLMTALVTGEVFGEPLTDEEVMSFILLLFPAGVDTTWLALGSMMTAVLSTPGAYESLREHPELRPGAVEESLRWETPVSLNPRISVRDTELSGVFIPAGSFCLQAIAAANREPDRFPDPDNWVVDRNPTDHISFSFGEHFCLGAHLARAEMLAALEVFTECLPNLHLADEVAFHGSSVRGPAAVKVAF